eukprot:1181118-Prorocentrum_minimum.AAC.1
MLEWVSRRVARALKVLSNRLSSLTHLRALKVLSNRHLKGEVTQRSYIEHHSPNPLSRMIGTLRGTLKRLLSKTCRCSPPAAVESPPADVDSPTGAPPRPRYRRALQGGGTGVWDWDWATVCQVRRRLSAAHGARGVPRGPGANDKSSPKMLPL